MYFRVLPGLLAYKESCLYISTDLDEFFSMKHSATSTFLVCLSLAFSSCLQRDEVIQPSSPNSVGRFTTEVKPILDRDLSIGIVTDARFVREALALLDDPKAVPAHSETAQQATVIPGLIAAEDAAYSR